MIGPQSPYKPSHSEFRRSDGRNLHQARPMKITTGVLPYAEGSCSIEFGKTTVFCSASYDPKVPSWLSGSGQGWITAEYSMLPRSTQTRIKRDKSLSGGRTQEISRLIGRSLRSCVDLKKLGEKLITIDCDVINADGGTRTASITGGFVALALALNKLNLAGELRGGFPMTHYVASISAGVDIDGRVLLDLNYEEDSRIAVDMNFVMNNEKGFIEVQGTGEKKAFSAQQLDEMLTLSTKACQDIFLEQEMQLKGFFPIP